MARSDTPSSSDYDVPTTTSPSAEAEFERESPESLPSIQQEDGKYATGKPKRITIRGRVTHD